MNINGIFQKKDNGKLEFSLKLNDIKKNLILYLKEVPDEHFPVILKDPSGNIRLLTSFKSKEKYFCIGKTFEDSSNCTIPGEMTNGNWKVEIVKPYLFEGNFVIEVVKDKEMKLENKFIDIFSFDYSKIYCKDKKWYQGELHAHTKFSDGFLTFERLLVGIKELELDFIFLTDHNVVSTKTPISEVPIIPSTELTLKNNGHFNFLGLKNLPDYSSLIRERKLDNEVLDEIFKWAKTQEALIVMNHPLSYMGINYNLNLDNFDLIEVLNSPYNKEKTAFNIKALKAFDSLLLNGYKIFAVGGSDSHDDFIDKKNSFLGNPLNYIHMDGFSVNNLIRSLKYGKCYISTVGKIEVFIYENLDELGEREVFIGDNVSSDKLRFKLSCKKTLNWRFILNGGIVKEVIGKTVEVNIQMFYGSYIRIEGLESDETLVILNPLFYGNIVKTKKQWLDICM
jgi:hypothetical protein